MSKEYKGIMISDDNLKLYHILLSVKEHNSIFYATNKQKVCAYSKAYDLLNSVEDHYGIRPVIANGNSSSGSSLTSFGEELLEKLSNVILFCEDIEKDL